MEKELQKHLENLQKAMIEYEKTEGTRNLEKEGDALKLFNKVVRESGNCWSELRSERLSPQ